LFYYFHSVFHSSKVQYGWMSCKGTRGPNNEPEISVPKISSTLIAYDQSLP